MAHKKQHNVASTFNPEQQMCGFECFGIKMLNEDEVFLHCFDSSQNYIHVKMELAPRNAIIDL